MPDMLFKAECGTSGLLIVIKKIIVVFLFCLISVQVSEADKIKTGKLQ